MLVVIGTVGMVVMAAAVVVGTAAALIEGRIELKVATMARWKRILIFWKKLVKWWTWCKRI